MKDFFISYNSEDRPWAEWIAWVLEEAGYSVVIQAWDFRPGGNFMEDMLKALENTEKTIAVFSEAYLNSKYGLQECLAALTQDPLGLEKKLIPIRVRNCNPPDLLKPIVYIDLVGMPEGEAQSSLLASFKERSKPDERPSYPKHTQKERGKPLKRPFFPEKVNLIRITGNINLPISEVNQSESALGNIIKSLDGVDINELVDILQKINEGDKNLIRSAYQFAAPNRRIFSTIPDDLKEILMELKGYSNGEILSPLYKFVSFSLLDESLDYELKGRLESWIRKKIDDLPSLLAEVKNEKLMREAKENPFLLLDVSKCDSKYTVQAWLIVYPEEYDSNYCVSDCHQIKIEGNTEWTTDKDLKSVSFLLRKFRDICVEKYCKKNIHQIHFFLPSELIGYNVDAWKSEEEEDEFSKTFGEGYELVIRYSERLRDRSEPVLKWREKGRKVKQRLKLPAAKEFVSGDESKLKKLFRKIDNDDIIAVKLIGTSQQKKLGSLLFKAGIPLALWIRKSLPDFDNPVILNSLLGVDCQENNFPALQDIPTRVKLKRLEAFDEDEPENHIGRHLSLLWDDPDLVPPKQLLSQKNL